MAEKKEKQWAVLKEHPSGRIMSIVWFDARKTARDYCARRNAKSRLNTYRVMPMTRGPGG